MAYDAVDFVLLFNIHAQLSIQQQYNSQREKKKCYLFIFCVWFYTCWELYVLFIYLVSKVLECCVNLPVKYIAGNKFSLKFL